MLGNISPLCGATNLGVVGNIIGFPSEIVVWGTNFFFGYADLINNIFKVAVSPIAAPALTISNLYSFSGTQSTQDAAAFLDNSGSAVVSYVLYDSGVSALNRWSR